MARLGHGDASTSPHRTALPSDSGSATAMLVWFSQMDLSTFGLSIEACASCLCACILNAQGNMSRLRSSVREQLCGGSTLNVQPPSTPRQHERDQTIPRPPRPRFPLFPEFLLSTLDNVDTCWSALSSCRSSVSFALAPLDATLTSSATCVCTPVKARTWLIPFYEKVATERYS